MQVVRMIAARAVQSARHEREGTHPAISTPVPWPDSRGQNPYRFMPMLRFHSLDQETGCLDWGVSCQACRLGPREANRGYHNWNTVFSVSGYMKHFKQCEVSQRGRQQIPKYISADKGGQSMHETSLLGFFNNFHFGSS